MEIGGISGTVVSGSQSASTSADARLSTVSRPERAHDSEHAIRKQRHHDHHHQPRGRALGVFRQELKLSLSASFRATFATSQPAYGQAEGAALTDQVAADTLGAAQRVVAEEPVDGSRSMIKFRQSVVEAATYTREMVGNDDDFAEVEGAVGRVLDGLSKLEDEAARNVESSASVLSVDTKTREQSSIKIRTQEGDIVKLNLTQKSALSATDVAVTNEDGTATTTEVQISSGSRLSLKVEGDLNEAELGAIQNVFAQAELIANEFFGGDVFAALDLATAFEYDAEQLSRVNMQFKSREVSTASYSEVRSAPVAAVEDDSAPVTVQAVPAADVQPLATPIATPVEEATVAAEAPVADDNQTALAGFFEMVSSFLRSVSEGFEGGADTGVSAKLHFSQSFKLEILKSVMQVAEPDQVAEESVQATPPDADVEI